MIWLIVFSYIVVRLWIEIKHKTHKRKVKSPKWRRHAATATDTKNGEISDREIDLNKFNFIIFLSMLSWLSLVFRSMYWQWRNHSNRIGFASASVQFSNLKRKTRASERQLAWLARLMRYGRIFFRGLFLFERPAKKMCLFGYFFVREFCTKKQKTNEYVWLHSIRFSNSSNYFLMFFLSCNWLNLNSFEIYFI